MKLKVEVTLKVIANVKEKANKRVKGHGEQAEQKK